MTNRELSISNSIAKKQFREQLLEKVITAFPDDVFVSFIEKILSCQIQEKLASKARFLNWSSEYPRMYLLDYEFDIELGLVQRFILTRDDLLTITQFLDIASLH